MKTKTTTLLFSLLLATAKLAKAQSTAVHTSYQLAQSDILQDYLNGRCATRQTWIEILPSDTLIMDQVNRLYGNEILYPYSVFYFSSEPGTPIYFVKQDFFKEDAPQINLEFLGYYALLVTDMQKPSMYLIHHTENRAHITLYPVCVLHH